MALQWKVTKTEAQHLKPLDYTEEQFREKLFDVKAECAALAGGADPETVLYAAAARVLGKERWKVYKSMAASGNAQLGFESVAAAALSEVVTAKPSYVLEPLANGAIESLLDEYCETQYAVDLITQFPLLRFQSPSGKFTEEDIKEKASALFMSWVLIVTQGLTEDEVRRRLAG